MAFHRSAKWQAPAIDNAVSIMSHREFAKTVRKVPKVASASAAG
jgi:hypothetical protein